MDENNKTYKHARVKVRPIPIDYQIDKIIQEEVFF